MSFDPLKTCSLISGVFALSTCALPGASAQAASSAKSAHPNIVLIFADDLGYGDLGCFGSKTIRTPNIDRMAREGARLTDFYVCSATCTPSRGGLLTGRLPFRTGLTRVLFPYDDTGIGEGEVTVADVMRGQGYATGCIGKWHLGHLPQYLPTRHGFDYYYGIPYSNDMSGKARKMPPVPLMRGEKIIEQPVEQDTLTQRYTEQACGFIRRHKAHPFFLYLPHTMPHIPLHAGEKFRGKSAGGLYGDVVEEIDWSTGEVLRTLHEEGLAENTLVIFTSDNGPWLQVLPDAGSAGILRAGKMTLYEGGIREPFVAYWPGRIPAGRTVESPAFAPDLFATFIALAGGRPPTDRVIDGRNMMGLLDGSGPREGSDFFIFTHADRMAAREGDWKLILAGKDAAKQPAELYDLKSDIQETQNLAADHPDIVKRLTSRVIDAKQATVAASGN